MTFTRENISKTEVKLNIASDIKAIDTVKQKVLKQLSQNLKISGFRPGKAPANIIEKHLPQAQYQEEFLNLAINQFYEQAIRHENITPIDQPKITITKFVPFSTLEFTAEVEMIGDINLPEYKSIQLSPEKINVKTEEINKVLVDLTTRAAVKKEIKGPLKAGQEAVIDFIGSEIKSKKPIDGASGKDYPLIIGGNTFIPGFEEKITGLITGDQKTFKITFPDNYRVGNLKNKPVNFKVTIKKINDLLKPKLDNNFAANVGPFKDLNELKEDIKKQLSLEKQKNADSEYVNKLMQILADKTTLAIPKRLIELEIDNMEEEEKRNLVYQGQTWQEHLKVEGVDEKQHRLRQHPMAETRVKIGIILGEVADKENITVSDEEFNDRLISLKKQYTDDNMQSELDQPNNLRDIKNRLLIDKTIDKLKQYASN